MKWRVLFTGPRGALTVGLVVLEFVTAIQSLVVLTIMPLVASDLGGFRWYGWAFSAFALGSLAAIPITAAAVDRRGFTLPLVLTLVLFTAGTVGAAAAPSMPVFVGARLLQGAGYGAELSFSLVVMAKVYPEAERSPLWAVLTGAWTVPTMVGPAFGVLIATTFNWRWAFLAVVPVVPIAGVLLFRALRAIELKPVPPEPLRAGWVLAMVVGSGLVFGGLSSSAWYGALLAAPGIALLVVALRRLLPPGSMTARRGLPATVFGALLTSTAFFGADAFLPLVVVGPGHRTLAEAGVAITLGSMAWSVGSYLQARGYVRSRAVRLTRLGAAGLAVGTAAAGLMLAGAPLAVLYVGWTIAGLGMGVAYPTLYLVAMESASPGREGAALAPIQLTDALGAALGTGLAGGALALATGIGGPIQVGLAVGFALGLVAALGVFASAPRIRPRIGAAAVPAGA